MAKRALVVDDSDDSTSPSSQRSGSIDAAQGAPPSKKAKVDDTAASIARFNKTYKPETRTNEEVLGESSLSVSFLMLTLL